MWISMVFGEPQLCKDSVVVVSGVVRVFDERVAKVVVGRAGAARAALARQWLLPQLSELRELADWRLAARAPGVCLGAIRALFRSAGGYGWGAGV